MANAIDNNATYKNPFLKALIGDTRWSTGDVVRYYLDPTGTSSASAGQYPAVWMEAGGGAAFEQAAKAWSAVANVSFARTQDKASADIVETIYRNPNDDTLGEHYLPNDQGLGGRFNAGRTDAYSETLNRKGGAGYDTFLHELGHALGLNHPFEGPATFPGVAVGSADDAGDFGFNRKLYTVMSYEDSFHGASDENYEFGWAATPMAFDIAAVQAIYGANMATATGDDVYLLPDANRAGTYYECIWDAGGIDTISAKGSKRPATIDLRAATLKDEEGGGGRLSYHVENSGFYIAGGYTIAKGVVIENAIGSSGDDTLIGNAADNRLEGGKGRDSLFGGEGRDTFVLSGGKADGDTISDFVSHYDRIDASALHAKSYSFEMNADGSYGLTKILVKLAHGYQRINLYGYFTQDDLAGLKCTSAKFYGTGEADTLHGTEGNDRIDGGGRNDLIDGGAGRDTLNGGTGSDTLYGGAGDDKLDGGLGKKDYLYGGDGDDTLTLGRYSRGGSGDDVYFVNGHTKVIEEVDGGHDTVHSSANYTLPGNVEDLWVFTYSAKTTRFGTGNALDNTIRSGGGTVSLRGLGGDDRLFGSEGDDTLSGGSGSDTLTGYRGADTFVFGTGERGNDAASADRITDFDRGEGDRIDLSSIDVAKAPGHQGLTFIGEAAFTDGVAGLRYEVDGKVTLLSADLDGDGTADLFIRVDGAQSFASADFLL